jgi:Rrf2 family protein
MFLYGKMSANAIAVMSYLASHPDKLSGSGEVAAARGIPKPLTAKLLTQLATAGLVSGQPGPNGGYRLARPAEGIRLLDIANVFEQTTTTLPCPFGHNWCGKGEPCPLHDSIARLQRDTQRFMETTRLSAFSPGEFPDKRLPT